MKSVIAVTLSLFPDAKPPALFRSLYQCAGPHYSPYRSRTGPYSAWADVVRHQSFLSPWLRCSCAHRAKAAQNWNLCALRNVYESNLEGIIRKSRNPDLLPPQFSKYLNYEGCRSIDVMMPVRLFGRNIGFRTKK